MSHHKNNRTIRPWTVGGAEGTTLIKRDKQKPLSREKDHIENEKKHIGSRKEGAYGWTKRGGRRKLN